jgi:hypothetical protein
MSLPPELHKEIIFWAVGPHARGSLPVGPHHAALASDKERERDRRELRDRRMTLIQVCRAWKVSLWPIFELHGDQADSLVWMDGA